MFFTRTDFRNTWVQSQIFVLKTAILRFNDSKKKVEISEEMKPKINSVVGQALKFHKGEVLKNWAFDKSKNIACWCFQKD